MGVDMYLIAKLISKIIYWVVKIFNLGSGFTLPGYLVLKWFPDILQSGHIKFTKGIILVSGTNGKTTTSSLIAHVLEKSGHKVIHNKSGSNLARGIASAILLTQPLVGSGDFDYGVFEVDEFYLSDILKEFSSASHYMYVVLLNLSRDQLDRYGETDIIFDRWLNVFRHLKPSPKLLVFNKDQPEFQYLNKLKNVPLVSFGSDPDLLAQTKLVGAYNAYNIAAARVVCEKLGIRTDAFLSALQTFAIAYGRGEEIALNSTAKNSTAKAKIFLAKNPASFNENLKLICTGNLATFPTFQKILIVLNDNIPDGRDVSWIYDIDPELLKKACVGKTVYVSGTRYLDMIVRLRYAGVDVLKENTFANLQICVASLTNADANVLILPNYSAMLGVRKLLLGREIL